MWRTVGRCDKSNQQIYWGSISGIQWGRSVAVLSWNLFLSNWHDSDQHWSYEKKIKKERHVFLRNNYLSHNFRTPSRLGRSHQNVPSNFAIFILQTRFWRSIGFSASYLDDGHYHEKLTWKIISCVKYTIKPQFI